MRLERASLWWGKKSNSDHLMDNSGGAEHSSALSMIQSLKFKEASKAGVAENLF